MWRLYNRFQSCPLKLPKRADYTITMSAFEIFGKHTDSSGRFAARQRHVLGAFTASRSRIHTDSVQNRDQLNALAPLCFPHLLHV
jgi:hypothetical protein